METELSSNAERTHVVKEEVFGFVLKRVPESLLVPIELKSKTPNKQRHSRPELQPKYESHTDRVPCGQKKKAVQEKEDIASRSTDDCQSVAKSVEALVNETDFVKTLSPRIASVEAPPISKVVSIVDETCLNVKERSCPTELLPASNRTERCTMSQEPSSRKGPPEHDCSELGTPTSSISDAIEVAREEDTDKGVIVECETPLEQEETSLWGHSHDATQHGVALLDPSLNHDFVAHDIEPPETAQEEEIIENSDDRQQGVPEGLGSVTEQENTKSLHIKTREFPTEQMFIDARHQDNSEITIQEASDKLIGSPKQVEQTEGNSTIATKSEKGKQPVLAQEGTTEAASKSSTPEAQLSPPVHTNNSRCSSQVQQQKLNKEERRKAQLHQSQQLTQYLSKSPSKQDEEELIHLANDLKAHVEQVYEEPPSHEEIKEFAAYLGMDVELDERWFFIAEWAMTAPLPVPWTVHLDSSGDEYFHNPETKISQYEHPMDEKYKELYLKLKHHNPDSN